MDFYDVGLRQGKMVSADSIDKETLMIHIYNRRYTRFNKCIKEIAGKQILSSTTELRRSKNQQDYFHFFAGLISGSERVPEKNEPCNAPNGNFKFW